MILAAEPVSGRRARRRFVELARRFRGRSPVWVPPLTGEVLRLLDPGRNPALRHARQRLWIARDERGGSRGRIAATWDPRHAANLGEAAGWFGFFDADGPETTRFLLDTAWAWLAEQGAESMLGPADPDTNHECGCLLEGYEEMPYLMMPHHPPEYAAWLEGAGLRKARDLLAYEVHDRDFPFARLERVVRRLEQRSGVRLQRVTRRHLPEVLDLALEVYNQAWRDNWGFLPMTREEFAFEAKAMLPLLDPDLALVATCDGRPAAFALGLPDANVALHAVHGRLWPTGFLRLPFLLRRVRRLRILTLGVVHEFRHRGLETVLVYRLSEASHRKGYHTAEMSWVLEDNEAMKRLAATFGGRLSRRYRIYRGPPAGA